MAKQKQKATRIYRLLMLAKTVQDADCDLSDSVSLNDCVEACRNQGYGHCTRTIRRDLQLLADIGVIEIEGSNGVAMRYRWSGDWLFKTCKGEKSS